MRVYSTQVNKINNKKSTEEDRKDSCTSPCSTSQSLGKSVWRETHSLWKKNEVSTQIHHRSQHWPSLVPFWLQETQSPGPSQCQASPLKTLSKIGSCPTPRPNPPPRLLQSWAPSPFQYKAGHHKQSLKTASHCQVSSQRPGQLP